MKKRAIKKKSVSIPGPALPVCYTGEAPLYMSHPGSALRPE